MYRSLGRGKSIRRPVSSAPMHLFGNGLGDLFAD